MSLQVANLVTYNNVIAVIRNEPCVSLFYKLFINSEATNLKYSKMEHGFLKTKTLSLNYNGRT